MGEMDAIFAEFLIESRENLDLVERGLVDLEKDPTDSETLASVFRAIHSIKGATGFLGLSKLGAVAHAGESLLSRLRDRKIVLSPAITSVLLALVDAIRQMLAGIERTRAEGDIDYTALIDRLAVSEAGACSSGVARRTGECRACCRPDRRCARCGAGAARRHVTRRSPPATSASTSSSSIT